MQLTLTRDNRGGFSCMHNGQRLVLSKFANLGTLFQTHGFVVSASSVEGFFYIALRIAPKVWAVEPVTDDTFLVNHRGFECEGSMCCTTAYAKDIWVGNTLCSYLTITPGRLNNMIRQVDNVSPSFYGREIQNPVPDVCYVRISDLKLKYHLRGEAAYQIRSCGVPTFDQIDPYFM